MEFVRQTDIETENTEEERYTDARKKLFQKIFNGP